MENNGNIISFDQIRTSPKYDLVNLCTELSDDHDIILDLMMMHLSVRI